MPYITNYGTPEQIEKYIPAMTAGEKIGCIAMTEPGAGSDLQVRKTLFIITKFSLFLLKISCIAIIECGQWFAGDIFLFYRFYCYSIYIAELSASLCEIYVHFKYYFNYIFF